MGRVKADVEASWKQVAMIPRCPHTDSFILDGTTLSARRIIELLAPTIQEERRERIADVVAGRSYTVEPVL